MTARALDARRINRRLRQLRGEHRTCREILREMLDEQNATSLASEIGIPRASLSLIVVQSSVEGIGHVYAWKIAVALRVPYAAARSLDEPLSCVVGREGRALLGEVA